MLVSLIECLQICSGLSRLSRKNHYCGGSLGLRALQPWTREGWWNKCRVISVRWSGPSVFLFVTALACFCSPLSGPRRGAGLCNLDQPLFSSLNINIRSSPACWRKRIVCGDFVRVNLSLVMLPITVSSSLMRLMDCQISPLQFSVF